VEGGDDAIMRVDGAAMEGGDAIMRVDDGGMMVT
jgi:hypothetical protein